MQRAIFAGVLLVCLLCATNLTAEESAEAEGAVAKTLRDAMHQVVDDSVAAAENARTTTAGSERSQRQRESEN